MEDLTQALADLKENEALEIVRLRLDRGDDPLQIIEDCQAGMREVGEQPSTAALLPLPGLIIAGDISPRESRRSYQPVGRGAASPGRPVGPRAARAPVQGDIHDLGKNLLLMLLRSRTDSPCSIWESTWRPARLCRRPHTFKPHAIGMSGLIAAYSTMRETVIALRAMMAEDGVQIPILLGGQVDEQVSLRGRRLLVD